MYKIKTALSARYNKGQQVALFDSLSKQKSPMTDPELKLYSELRDLLAERINIGGTVLLMNGSYIKEIEKDTFGEDYRSRWTRIISTSKGDYFYSSYQGKRIYLT